MDAFRPLPELVCAVGCMEVLDPRHPIRRAQHIRLENVCGFHSVRYSQIPASGTPASDTALRASPSINRKAAGERSALMRSSRKIGVSANTISP